MDQALIYGLAGWDLLVLGLFAATLMGLAWGRAFLPATLRRGPRRDVGFGLHDLAMALGAFAAGVVLSGLVVSAWLSQSGVEKMADLSPMSQARVSAVYPWVMWGPGIVYLLVRLTRTGNLRLGGAVPRRPLRDLWVAAAGVPVAFILAMGLSVVVALLLVLFRQPLPEHGHTVLKTMTEPGTPRPLIALLAFSAIVVAPITEEFFFRGLLQTALQSVIGHDKRWLSILPVAVFFGVIHLGAVPGAMVPVLVLLGVVFGWVYERTGSLWCAVLVHAGFNASSIALSLIGAGP